MQPYNIDDSVRVIFHARFAHAQTRTSGSLTRNNSYFCGEFVHSRFALFSSLKPNLNNISKTIRFCVERCQFCFYPKVSESDYYVRVFAIAIPSVVCRLSVVCNVGAPYSDGWSFRQYFFTAVYLSHPLTSVQTFTEIVPGEPLRRES